MSLTVLDYPNVADRAVRLGCSVPAGMAILPRNFDIARSRAELGHESSVPAIRALWQQTGLRETPLEPAEHEFAYVHEKASRTWNGPLIYFSAALLHQDEGLVARAVGIIQSYLSLSLREGRGPKNARLGVVLERGPDHNCRLVIYEGEVDGIDKLVQAAMDAVKDG